MTKITKLSTIIFALLVSFLLFSCSSDNKEEANKSNDTNLDTKSAKMIGSNENVAGINWKIPESWTKGEKKQMRVATYLTKGENSAECAVFYFGSNQGGNADANIKRWVNQIKQPDGSLSSEKATESTMASACCKIKLVEVDGSYLSSSGPMMKVVDEKADYTLMGAIVEAPEGNVFFKLTGPQKIVKEERGNFLLMLKEIE